MNFKKPTNKKPETKFDLYETVFIVSSCFIFKSQNSL